MLGPLSGHGDGDGDGEGGGFVTHRMAMLYVWCKIRKNTHSRKLHAFSAWWGLPTGSQMHVRN